MSTEREFLMARAKGRCEYCHTPEKYLALGLHVDHIIAQQHHGADGVENLAMACAHCNTRKGPNIASIDVQTKHITGLINPRKDRWSDHFRIERGVIHGKTPVGRVTVLLLAMNNSALVLHRSALRKAGIRFN